MRRLFVVLAAVAGCVGGSATTSDSASTSVESVAETVAETEPPTTEPPTSEPPETEPSATELPAAIASTTSTTIAPTTTVLSLEQIAADIERELNLGEQAFLEAGADPGAQESRRLVADYFTGTILEWLDGYLDGLEADGHLLRPNPEIPVSVEVLDVLDIDDAISPSLVMVRTCRIDSAIVVDPSGAEDVVVNGDVARYVADTTVSAIDGRWKATQVANEARTAGVFSCSVS